MQLHLAPVGFDHRPYESGITAQLNTKSAVAGRVDDGTGGHAKIEIEAPTNDGAASNITRAGSQSLVERPDTDVDQTIGPRERAPVRPRHKRQPAASRLVAADRVAGESQ